MASPKQIPGPLDHSVTFTRSWPARQTSEKIAFKSGFDNINFRVFSPEYFCPNHQRFARNISKISVTGGAEAPLAPRLERGLWCMVFLIKGLLSPYSLICGTKLFDLILGCHSLLSSILFLTSASTWKPVVNSFQFEKYSNLSVARLVHWAIYFARVKQLPRISIFCIYRYTIII